MMLTQRLSLLAHDLGKQCRLVKPAEKPKEQTSPSIYNTRKMETPRNVHTCYDLGETIGTGGFGSVYAGTSRLNGDSVAIKVIPKSKVYGWSKAGSRVVPREIALLSELDHKFIIKMIDYFEDTDHFYIIMERPEKYIDLFDYITQKGTVSERSSRYLFRQVVQAVQYCLSKGVLHRDVKDENILIDLKDNHIKLIDFGSGASLQEEVYTEYEGTRVYCPPEWVLSHRYHAVPATVWSLGILLYDMLMGDVPFEKESEIVACHLPFQVDISSEAKSLIQWMLAFRPNERPSIEQILSHPWFKMGTPVKSQPKAPAPQVRSSPYLTRAAFSSTYTPPSQSRSMTHLQQSRPGSSAGPPSGVTSASPCLSRNGSVGSGDVTSTGLRDRAESKVSRTPSLINRKARPLPSRK